IARGWMETGQAQKTAATLDSLFPELEARRDTMLLTHALGVLGRAEERRRRSPQATQCLQRAARLAARAGLRSEEAGARIGIADIALDGHSDQAVVEYRRALRLLRAPRDSTARLAAHFGLGRALTNLGDAEGSR